MSANPSKYAIDAFAIDVSVGRDAFERYPGLGNDIDRSAFELFELRPLGFGTEKFHGLFSCQIDGNDMHLRSCTLKGKGPDGEPLAGKGSWLPFASREQLIIPPFAELEGLQKLKADILRMYLVFLSTMKPNVVNDLYDLCESVRLLSKDGRLNWSRAKRDRQVSALWKQKPESLIQLNEIRHARFPNGFFGEQPSAQLEIALQIQAEKLTLIEERAADKAVISSAEKKANEFELKNRQLMAQLRVADSKRATDSEKLEKLRLERFKDKAKLKELECKLTELQGRHADDETQQRTPPRGDTSSTASSPSRDLAYMREHFS